MELGWLKDEHLRARRLRAERRALAVKSLKDLEGMSVEELRLAIERLELMAKLAGLLGKHEEAAAYEAHAKETAATKAEYAAQANKARK